MSFTEGFNTKKAATFNQDETRVAVPRTEALPLFGLWFKEADEKISYLTAHLEVLKDSDSKAADLLYKINNLSAQIEGKKADVDELEASEKDERAPEDVRKKDFKEQKAVQKSELDNLMDRLIKLEAQFREMYPNVVDEVVTELTPDEVERNKALPFGSGVIGRIDEKVKPVPFGSGVIGKVEPISGVFEMPPGTKSANSNVDSSSDVA